MLPVILPKNPLKVCPIAALPDDILTAIIKKLSHKDRLSFSLSCQCLSRIARGRQAGTVSLRFPPPNMNLDTALSLPGFFKVWRQTISKITIDISYFQILSQLSSGDALIAAITDIFRNLTNIRKIVLESFTPPATITQGQWVTSFVYSLLEAMGKHVYHLKIIGPWNPNIRPTGGLFPTLCPQLVSLYLNFDSNISHTIAGDMDLTSLETCQGLERLFINGRNHMYIYNLPFLPSLSSITVWGHRIEVNNLAACLKLTELDLSWYEISAPLPSLKTSGLVSVTLIDNIPIDNVLDRAGTLDFLLQNSDTLHKLRLENIGLREYIRIRLHHLKHLSLKNTTFPNEVFSLNDHSHLHTLYIDGVYHTRNLGLPVYVTGQNDHSLHQLHTVSITHCSSLSDISLLPPTIISLTLSFCPALSDLTVISTMSNLTLLDLFCLELVTDITFLSGHPSLRTLVITYMPNVNVLPLLSCPQMIEVRQLVDHFGPVHPSVDILNKELKKMESSIYDVQPSILNHRSHYYRHIFDLLHLSTAETTNLTGITPVYTERLLLE